MKKIKIFLTFFLLSSYLGAYSINSESVLFDSKAKLLQTQKGKEYYDIFAKILDKYGNNTEVMERLQLKVNNLKKIIELENKYSMDIYNLVNYMYIFVNQNELFGDDKQESTDLEKDPVVIYPGFTDEYIDDDKSIITGKEYIVFSGKTSSKYESVDVGSIRLYIEGSDVSDIQNSIKSMSLYLEGYHIDTISNRNIDIISSTRASVLFENLSNFIVPQKEVEFRLGIIANDIGNEKLGKPIKNLKISKISLYNAVGTNSGNNINAFTTSINSSYFSIVPGLISINLLEDLNTSTRAKISVLGEFGDNTNDTSKNTPKIALKTLKMVVHDNSSSTEYKLMNSNDSGDYIIGVKRGTLVEFDISSMKDSNKTISEGNGEEYEIYINNTSGSVFIKIPKDGLIYDVIGITGAEDLNINMESKINLGFRTY